MVHTRFVILMALTGVAALYTSPSKWSNKYVQLVSCTSSLDIRVASSLFVPCFGSMAVYFTIFYVEITLSGQL